MKKVRVSLEKATERLSAYKVFLSGNGFNLVDAGKYHSGWTMVIPREWEVDENDEPIVPDIFSYRKNDNLTNGMNVDFDGDCSVLYGNYHKSQTGRPVFAVTDPKNATHVIVRSSWGGAFNHSRGQDSNYAQEIGALEFRRARSNGGGSGYDYYIFPANHINAPEQRDVKEILEKDQKALDQERADRDTKVSQIKAEREKALQAKERVIEEVTKIANEYNENHDDRMKVLFYDYKMEVTLESGGLYHEKMYYSEENVQKIKSHVEEVLKREQQIKEQTEKNNKIIEKLAPYTELLNSIEAKISFNTNYFSVTFLTKELPVIRYDRAFQRNEERGGSQSIDYPYSESSIIDFAGRLVIAVEDYKIRKMAEREKEQQALAKIQQAEAEKEAKEKGYPSNFSFYNRQSGATGLSHAYVISSNGDIRDPDDNILKNINHRHYYSDPYLCIARAEGMQIYNQILPGEIILTYSKEYTKAPYLVNIEWADGMPTEDQLLVMVDLLEKMIPEDNPYGFTICDYEDVLAENPTPIVDYKAWVLGKTKERVKECQRELEDARKERAISLSGIEAEIEKAQNQENNTI